MSKTATKIVTGTSVIKHDVVRFPLVHINETFELWMRGTGPFSRAPDTTVELQPGWHFKQGSVYVNGHEVTRAVKPKSRAFKNHALPGWAILRKAGHQLEGYTFFREILVSQIPDTQAHHDENKAWYLERMGKIVASKSALWNKYRTILAIRKAMRDYGLVLDQEMPGPSSEEIATMAHLKIMPSADLRPEDAQRIVQAYVALYGQDWAEDTGVVLPDWK